ncbi:tetratricopeptide repeat protein [Spirochaetota bacterium]
MVQSKEYNFRRILPWALILITLCVHMYGEYAKDVRVHKKHVITDMVEAAELFNKSGIKNYNEGKLESALKDFTDAMHLFEKIDHQNGIIAVLLNIALVYFEKGNRGKADDLINKALSRSQLLRYKKGIADSYHKSGLVSYRSRDYIKAIKYYQQSLKLYNDIGQKAGIAAVHNSIALCYNNTGDLDKAKSSFTRAITANKSLKNYKGISANYINLCNLYIKKKNNKKALLYAKKSLAIDKQLEDSMGIALVLNIIANLYEKMGDFEQTYFHYERAYSVNHSLRQEEREINDLENLIRIGKKLKKTRETAEYEASLQKIRQ